MTAKQKPQADPTAALHRLLVRRSADNLRQKAGMMYTVGHAETYRKAAASNGDRLHKDAGGCAFETRAQAERYLRPGYSVFSMAASLKDTKLAADGLLVLLSPVPLISEFPFSGRDIRRAFAEPVTEW